MAYACNSLRMSGCAHVEGLEKGMNSLAIRHPHPMMQRGEAKHLHLRAPIG